MADIELVIKINKDSYKATCNGYMLPPDVENVVQGIKNGIPLPKGHGRLIDADALICEAETCIETTDAFIELIQDAHAIIEADEESEE